MFSPVRPASVAFVASLALAGCKVTTSVVPTNAPPRGLAPRSVIDVEVLTSRAPSEPYVEVAVLQSRDGGSYGMAPTPKLIHSMREQAALFGCDALLVYGANNPPSADESRAFEGLWGACLVYTNRVAPVPIAAAPGPVVVGATAAPAAVAPVAVAPVAVAPVAAAPVAPVAAAPVAAAPVAAAPVAGGVFARMFDRLDRNRDGVLAPDEIPARARARLMRLDTSRDGWLTRDEVASAEAEPAPSTRRGSSSL